MDEAIELTLTRVRTEEGFRALSYTDSTGHETIGYGFNVSAGITKFAADALCRAQLFEKNKALLAYQWYQGLDNVRRSVLLDMAFNMGLGGLLHFSRMLASIDDKNWQQARANMLDSEAARGDPSRYKALADLLLSGSPEIGNQPNSVS